jgi:hypothetical protein
MSKNQKYRSKHPSKPVLVPGKMIEKVLGFADKYCSGMVDSKYQQ